MLDFFQAAVVTAYQDTVDAATIQTKFLGQVEKVAHLRTAGVTWALLNKYLFLQLVFQDSEILDGTSRLISLTKYSDTHIIASLSFFQNGVKMVSKQSGFQMCFAPSTLDAGGPNQNTSRIQIL